MLPYHSTSSRLTGSTHTLSPRRHPAMAVAQAAVGYLSAVIRVPFNDIVDPPRNIATIRLPAANIGSICAIHAEVEQPAAGVSMSAASANHGHVLPDSVDSVSGWLQLLRLCLDCVYWEVRLTGANCAAQLLQCPLQDAYQAGLLAVRS